MRLNFKSTLDAIYYSIQVHFSLMIVLNNRIINYYDRALFYLKIVLSLF